MTKRMDHAAYQRAVKHKSDAELRYIIKDASEAAQVNPQGEELWVLPG